MNKLKKIFKSSKVKDLICNLIFAFTYLIIIFIITNNGKYVLASTTDFESQHYIIPEYFRTLFYNTFDFFPDFAFNLGGGENIYYFSYYGLFSPIILISYLFPMIKMLDYIIVAMMIVVLCAVSLFYFYLRKNKYSHLISFLCSFMLLCSAPLIFHSHRHIMFIDYMPFLIMGFYGIDEFLYKKKSFLLILSSLLMIFTSYYYSVAGIVVLFIFGIFRYMQINNFRFKEILLYGINLIKRFIISILISAILILPTLYTLLNGRANESNITINLFSLFKPNFYMLYSSYSMGLTFICLIATVYMLFKGKRANKFLSIILLLISIFPIFSFVLNGLLYVNAKVLIPFIPLVLINVGDFFNKVFKNKKLKYLLVIYVIISSFTVCLIANLTDNLVESSETKKISNIEYNDKIKKIIDSDNLYRINSSFLGKPYLNKIHYINEYKTSLYSSTINNNYKKIYNNLFNNAFSYRNSYMLASNNLLFQIYMGEKYLISDIKYDYIYEKVSDINENISIYRNKYVLPIGYATDEIINEDDFDALRYPSNIINMLGRAVVDDEKTNSKIFDINDYEMKYTIESFNNLKGVKKDYGYEIMSKDDGEIVLKSNEKMANKIVIVNFDILEVPSCKKGDLAIKINGEKNKLTCREWKYANKNNNFNYAFVLGNDNTLKITFDKGLYKIGNIKTFLVDFNLIKDINEKISPFIIDKNKTKGDNIVGNIDVLENGYFVLSVPYDKGFNVFVDGKKIKSECVNKYFLGFKISKGNHKIVINYEAPYKRIAILFSFIGIVLYLYVFIKEKRENI